MKYIFVVTLKHMKSHFGRGFMILFSIMLSAGLVYAVLNISLLTEDILQDSFLKDYGSTNVLIYQKNNESLDELISDIDNSEYIIPTNTVIGYTELDSKYIINMMSYTIDEFNKIYDFNFIEKLNIDILDNHIIIGERNHIKYGLDIGSQIDVAINGVNHTFTVYGIIEEGTTFLDYNSNTIDVIVTKEFITNELGITNPNLYMINLIDLNEMDSLITLYPEYEVVNLLDNDIYLQEMRTLSSFLVIMAFSVILISAFIIFSTYKIIVIERLPFLGTLRSVGASKRFGTIALILESTIYGLIGGLLGVLTGTLFLFGVFELFFVESFENANISSTAVLNVNFTFALLTVITAIALSVFSSLYPIFQTKKYTIKQVMFGEINNVKNMKYRNSIIGIVLLVIAVILVLNSTYETAVLFTSFGMLFAVIGCVLLIPLLIILVVPIITYILYPLFGNKVLISSKNIRYDKTLINNIVLLAVGLGFIFMINNFSTSVGKIVTDVYSQAEFDLIIQSNNLSDDVITEIDNLDGITNTFVTKTKLNIETTEGFTLSYLIGADIDDYHVYAWDEFSDVLNFELSDRYENENTIIITNFTARKYDLKLDEYINLIVNDEVVTLEVIGIVSSFNYNGTQSFISYTLFEEIFKTDGTKTIYLQTNQDISVMKNAVKELYMYGVLPIDTLEELEQYNIEGNDMLFGLMKAISVLAMMIGAIGIINNFTVSFISRRKLIASLRSLGLSIRSTVYLFMVESLITGIIGSTLGVIFGIVFFWFITFTVEAMNITTEYITYNIGDMVFIFVSGIVISLVAALLPSWNISQRNIVQEIKYEG